MTLGDSPAKSPAAGRNPLTVTRTFNCTLDRSAVCFKNLCDIPWYMSNAGRARNPQGMAAMRKIAKLFKNGRSQAVRLPSDFRFTSREVFIRKDPETGDVILSRKPGSWDDLFAVADTVEIPADFLASRDRRPPKKRRLF